MKARVVIGLSGGVDSAVAASLILDQGYDVVGAHLRLWTHESPGDASPTGRGEPSASDRARRVADHLSITLRVVDVRSAFRDQVVDYFIAEYARGCTPNPCVICNPRIKFESLLDLAEELGAAGVATGHYARVRADGERYQILRGTDPQKDQSYFLHALDQAQLARIIFPVGHLTKKDVRAFARCRGLPVAAQSESQDICFLPEGDYREFLAAQAPHVFCPGDILDRSGSVIGEHGGLPAFTIGQRKGLGIAFHEPLYVLEIDPSTNSLTVGPASELKRDECTLDRVRYISGESPATTFEAEAQIRYRARPVPVIVYPAREAGARVEFSSPQRSITPGQFLVLYDGERVLGGGAISAL